MVLWLPFLIGLMASQCQAHSSHLLGRCPYGWKEAGGYICHRFFGHTKESDFWTALRSCHDEKSSDDVKQQLNEDESLLLTLGKLYHFNRDGEKAEDYFDHSIRLNAVKYNGIWYEIQRVPHEYIHLHELPSMVNHVQALTVNDFIMLGFPTWLYGEGHNGDGLIFNPDENMIKVSDLDFQHPFICTHKRISKPGNVI